MAISYSDAYHGWLTLIMVVFIWQCFTMDMVEYGWFLSHSNVHQGLFWIATLGYLWHIVTSGSVHHIGMLVYVCHIGMLGYVCDIIMFAFRVMLDYVTLWHFSMFKLDCDINCYVILLCLSMVILYFHVWKQIIVEFRHIVMFIKGFVTLQHSSRVLLDYDVP